MNPRGWAVLSALLGALGSLGCTGDDTPPRFFDSGTDAPSDVAAEAGDAGDAAAGDVKLIVVNASADLGPVRLCIALGTQNDGSDAMIVPATPLPAGSIGPGAGVVLPDLGDLFLDALTPYAVLSQSIGTSAQTCDSLVQVLAKNKDYFVLPTLKQKTLVAGTTVMLSVTGCVPQAIDPGADPTTCGSSYDATNGNLVATEYTLDKVIGNTARFGAQVVHSASATAGVWFSTYGTHGMNALLRPLDGGADEIIAGSIQYQQIAPMSGAASLAMPVIDQTSLVVSSDNADAGGATAIPLPLVYEVTTGQSTGEKTYFVAGANYTFVVVGDPRAPATLDGGILNGYALHALAFPNDPTVPSH